MRHDFARLRTCFSHDCTMSGYPPPAPELIVGGDAIVDYIVRALEKYGRTQHLLGQCLVEIDGDTARAETYVQAFHLLAADPNQTAHLFGSYLDHFVRTDAGWVIDDHRIDIIHIDRRTTAT
jgi:hypothetical protein